MGDKDPRFTFVFISALYCKMALTEILYLSEAVRSQEELNLLNSYTIRFYRITLQYCFNSEYNKLLEPDRGKAKKKHMASLHKLNNTLYNADKIGFQPIYSENKKLLQSIVKSDFHDKQRQLRNKKFSHADQAPIDNPLQIRGLTDEEIKEGFEHLKIVYQVLNNCVRIFGVDYDPHIDDSTNNFIKYHAIYQKYFHDNYMRAHTEGYKLH